jgi:hypothetical protein
MAAFQFYLQLRKQESRVSGDDGHVVFDQKFHDEKGSVRQYVVVMQEPVLLSPKFSEQSLHIFMQSL